VRGSAFFGLACALVATSATAAPARALHVAGRVDVHEAVGGAGLPARTLYIALPAAYDSTARYPVLYLQDGQDLFDAGLASGGEEWGLDELMAARPAGIPPLVIVGIAAAAEAGREYAPPGTATGARADAYVRFVVEVVKPYVDARYATRSEPEWTWIGGAGAGAVAALYAAWLRSDVFGAGIALALPDFDTAALAWVRATTPAPGLRLWIEQQGGADVRGSTTQLLTDFGRGARVDLRVAGRDAAPMVRLAAALRAVAGP